MAQRIYIVGIVASGKTTLAKALSKKTGLPFYELDTIVHGGDGVQRRKRTSEEQKQIISDIDAAGGWIIEGTYRKSCHCLLDLADTIVFLDTPLHTRLYRIFFRFIKQQLGIEHCHYKSDVHMLRMMYKWTWDFERGRPGFMEMLAVYRQKLIVISKPSELEGIA